MQAFRIDINFEMYYIGVDLTSYFKFRYKITAWLWVIITNVESLYEGDRKAASINVKARNFIHVLIYKHSTTVSSNVVFIEKCQTSVVITCEACLFTYQLIDIAQNITTMVHWESHCSCFNVFEIKWRINNSFVETWKVNWRWDEIKNKFVNVIHCKAWFELLK